MEEAQIRRQRLLDETRSLYSDSYLPPAVHPRFRASYSQLYRRTDENDEIGSTFIVRCFLCFLLFSLFVAMDYKDASIAAVNTKQISKEIRREMNMDGLKSVWKEF